MPIACCSDDATTEVDDDLKPTKTPLKKSGLSYMNYTLQHKILRKHQVTLTIDLHLSYSYLEFAFAAFDLLAVAPMFMLLLFN